MSLWAIDENWQKTELRHENGAPDVQQNHFQMASVSDLSRNDSITSSVTAARDAGRDLDPDNDLSWKALLYGYSQNTSLHGIKYIGEQTRFIARRILWTLVVLASFGFFIYYSYSRIRFYFQFTKNVNVEVNYLQKVRFPAVTFCNQNAFRITAVAENNWYDMIKTVFYPPSDQERRNCSVDEEFVCLSDSTCISLNARCDGFPDCKDASDEQNCDPCPLLSVTGSNVISNLIPDAIGRKYELQPNTWPTYLAYVTSDTPYVILYTAGGRWHFSRRYLDDEDLAYVDDSASAPQLIATGSTWFVNVSGAIQETKDIQISCEIPFKELLVEKPLIIEDDLDLNTLYTTAAHQEEEFIQSCLWKGNPCEPGSIQKRLTDMGVCFTFNSSDMFIEQSGPGYGLTLTVNIEQYEYTKNTDDGIGIKLLMHEADDVPMMSERGTAVSPGLYSFISVETTAVSNLEPPWGTCGQRLLKYFDSYSVSKCVSECETDIVDKACQCRHLQMPEKEGKPVVCDIIQYVNCAKLKLDELRAAGNYCLCPTPCNNDQYVPTTSFSIVLGSNGNSQDEKTHSLQTKVFTAREVTYRVVKEKNMATRKVFHLINQHTMRIIKFTLALGDHVTMEYESIVQRARSVQADCNWIRAMLVEARREIEARILRPVADLRRVLWTEGVQRLREFDGIVSETLRTLDEYTVFDEWNATYFAQQNATLWQYYQTMKATLNVILSELRPDVAAQVDSLPDLPHFRLRADLVERVRPELGDACTWCANGSSGTVQVMSTLKSRVSLIVNSQLVTDVGIARHRLEVAYDVYLADLWVTNITGDVFPENVTTAKTLVRLALSRLDSALRGLDQALRDSEDVIQLVDDLESYTWQVQCVVRLSKLMEEYAGNQRVIGVLLDEQQWKLNESYKIFVDNQIAYINGTIYLADVSREQNTDAILTTLTANKLRLDGAINDRLLFVHNLHMQINQIYYWLMMQVDSAYIATRSSYWSFFGMTAPGTQLPDIQMINGVPVLASNYGIIPNQAATDFWEDWLDNLIKIKLNLITQTVDLSTALTGGKEYLEAYVKGNQLDEAFYSKNFLQVELFYKELTERKVSQQKAYDFQNLLSEIGGLMGLLLGASVLSIMEMLDLLIYNCLRKCCVMMARGRVSPRRSKNGSESVGHSLSMI